MYDQMICKDCNSDGCTFYNPLLKGSIYKGSCSYSPISYLCYGENNKLKQGPTSIWESIIMCQDDACGLPSFHNLIIERTQN